MRLILIAFAFLLVFFLSSRVKVFRTEDCSTPSSVLHIWEFAVAICRRNLPWEFSARICRGFFCIYKRILFCICEQILFIWKQTFFICEQNVLICEIFSINSVSFCHCRGSYGPPYIYNNWSKLWSKSRLLLYYQYPVLFQKTNREWKCLFIARFFKTKI